MKLKPTLKVKNMHQSTARDFSGGLDLVDSEFNLTSKYGVAGYNMVPNENGDLQVRWGTRLFATSGTSRIVGMEYFFAYVIAVRADGTITATDASGVSTEIWNSATAATLPGTPAGWSATSSVSFGQFLGELIIANGIDKPLIVSKTLVCQYLQDLGSGSNLFTPVAKYVISHSNYVVMAGDADFPGRLYISNAGTSGTWPGDALPNDAITFDADKYAPDTVGEITGLATYRDKLIVFFAKYIITVKLGTYNTAATPVHTPVVNDIIPSYGAVSHKSIMSTGDTLMFMDYTGVATIRSTVFTTEIQPERASTLIDTAMQGALSKLSRGFLQERCFVIYDRRESRALFFVPAVEDTDVDQFTKVYVATLRPKSKTVAWTEYQGWNFQAGCVSAEGRVFFGNDTRIFRHGSRFEPILSDYEGYAAFDGTADDGSEVYVYGIYCTHAVLGTGIKFYHEMPNNPLGDRTVWKGLHYITMDTQGASNFTLSYYLDDLKKRTTDVGATWSDGTLFSDGTGWLPLGYTPYASMSFVGGDRGAELALIYGAAQDQVRATDNMNLYALYGRFRFIKLALSGTSYSHLRIVSMSLYYTSGSIY